VSVSGSGAWSGSGSVSRFSSWSRSVVWG
jgi:hypothetical protein